VHLCSCCADDRPRYGDKLTAAIGAAEIVLSYGCAVLGAWTALILSEQVTYGWGHLPKRQMVLWLSASSAALAIGLWSCAVVGLSAYSFPSNLSDRVVSYRSVNVFTALLVTFAGAFLAFFLMTFTLSSRTMARKTHSDLEGVSQIETESNDPQSNVSGADTGDVVARLEYLKNNADAVQAQRSAARRERLNLILMIVLASVVLTGTVIGVHFLIITSLELPVSIQLQSGLSSAGAIASLMLCCPALLITFHLKASSFRWMGAFMLAGGLLICQVLLLFACSNFVFTGINTKLPGFAGVVLTHDITASLMQIIAAVLTCVASFVFIGLNVTRLRLSKDVLDRFLLQAQKKIRALEVGTFP
jgi:hypothetical protein